MNDTEKPFIVKSEKALVALKYWLKERGCNTYSWSSRGRITVGYDADPSNDWSKKYQWRGTIIVINGDLFDATCSAIERAYGWPEKQSGAA